jgi:hypothetical protein
MAAGSNAQTAVGKLGSDLMGDWSAISTWYANAAPEVQAAFHQALTDAEAAGSAVASAIKSVTPKPATK